MKSTAVVLLAMLLVAGLAYAGTPAPVSKTLTEDQLDRIEANLVVGLKSGIPSLQTSALFVLRLVKAAALQHDFSSAIIPVMAILRDEEQACNARILATLALNDLKSGRGNYAISMVARFADEGRLKHVCQWLEYYRKLAAYQEKHGNPAAVSIGSR